MPDINQTLANLLLKYADTFVTSTHTGATRKILQSSVPPEIAGVYMIAKKNESHRPLYIGSSGKIGRGLETSGSSIRTRLFNASTPYRFKEEVFCFGPTSAKVPPDGYTHEIPLNDLQIVCFRVPNPKIPAAWEHLLIQGFINQFGDLPIANQKI